jgi:hypothetical protein
MTRTFDDIRSHRSNIPCFLAVLKINDDRCGARGKNAAVFASIMTAAGFEK